MSCCSSLTCDGFQTMRYFEDIEIGETGTMGAYPVSAEEIVSFARDYDPLPFHTDETAARQSMTGGLIASGWHVCAIQMRIIYDHFLKGAASMGSFGLDFINWRKPVRPGDVLSCRYEILSKRASRSRPDMGIVKVRWELIDQGGEVKAETEGAQLFTVRAPAKD